MLLGGCRYGGELPMSREQETEADELGLEIMVQLHCMPFPYNLCICLESVLAKPAAFSFAKPSRGSRLHCVT